MSQFLNYSDLHLTSDRTVSGMLSSSPAALGTLGHPVQATMGAHPVVTWSTSVHPVHRHVTSAYPLVGAVGPSPSVDYMTPSLSTNPFVDAGYCFGLPPPPTGTPVPDATRMTSSLSTAAAVTVTSSLIAATTSGMTSRPSDPFVVGAQAFDGQPTSSVHVAVVSTPSSATVTLVPDSSTLNFVVQGTDAVRGRSMFPVGAMVADVPPTDVAVSGSTSTMVKSAVEGVRGTDGTNWASASILGTTTQPTTVVDVGQSSTTSMSSVVVPGVPTGTSTSSTSGSSPPTSASSLTTSTTSAAPPVVVVRQFQTVRPYDGSTNWKLFRDHFYRVAKVNSWTTPDELIQHLTLALVGRAAEVLHDFNDASTTAVDDLWKRLEHTFGEVEESREARRRFEARRQSDTESLVGFEQGLRSLFKIAWPTASAETRDATLKMKLEDGVASAELSQYLRLHHRDLTFEQTVEKARIYHSTMEGAKSKKAVRFLAEPDVSPDLLPLVNQLKAIEGRLDKVIRDTKSTTSSTSSPSPTPSSMSATVPTSSQSTSPPSSIWCPRGPPAAQPQHLGSRFGGQAGFQPRQSAPASTTFQTPTSPANRFAGPSSGFGFRRVPGCFVCGEYRCHSDFHRRGGSSRPGQRVRRNMGCYVCGRHGCHSVNHPSQSSGLPFQRPSSVPPTDQSQGNSDRSPMSGTRTPSPVPRPQSR